MEGRPFIVREAPSRYSSLGSSARGPSSTGKTQFTPCYRFKQGVFIEELENFDRKTGVLAVGSPSLESMREGFVHTSL